MNSSPASWLVAALIALASAAASGAQAEASADFCPVQMVVLGIAQDAGMPQLGNPADPAWRDRSKRRLATSLGLIDRRHQRRYLFEATPDLREQLQRLDEVQRWPQRGLGIAGIFLTHAHIGHYAGLIFLGHESAGADGVVVYAMPRMAEYLRNNGPWDQLVRYRNIELAPLAEGSAVALADGLSVTPHRVPHRDEYSETVGFSIAGPNRALLFIPDIDSWDRWESEFGMRIEDQLAEHDLAYVDATFYDDHELPGRDMSAIPHPRISTMMDRFDALPTAERHKLRFIHLNHTNPARYPDSKQSRTIRQRGYRVAEEGERECL